MVLLPRLPNNQNPLHSYDASSSVAAPGSFVHLLADGSVAKISTSGQKPFAILFSKVTGDLPGVPAFFQYPGTIGASDQRLGDPVLLYQEGGSFETDLYDYTGGAGLSAGDLLYVRINDVSTDGMLTDDSVDIADNGDGSTAMAVAVVLQPLTHAEASASKMLSFKLLI